jgi:putative nucleotidyltransferase with HDIG domain
MKKSFLFIAACALFLLGVNSKPAFAQDFNSTHVINGGKASLSAESFLKEFVSRNWNAEDGLPGNTITDIVQDQDGYIYFGTYGGLLRFDGVEFVSINRLYNPKYDFLSARTMFMDSRGNLWVGSNDEGVICLKKNGDVQHFSVKDGLPNNSVRSFCEDKEGTIWVGTSAGLGFISKAYQVFKIPGAETIPNDNRFIVSQLYCDTAGRVWVTTRTENGLYCYSGGQFEVSHVIKAVDNPIVTTVNQDASGAFWFGISPYYAVKHTSDAETIYDLGTGSQKGTVVNRIFQDSEKNIWFALDNGITIMRDGVLYYCDTDDFLADDSINDIIEDREKNIWMALDRGGIQKLSYGKFQTTNMPTTVNAIVQDTYRDAVWLGGDNGLYCYQNNKFVENEITRTCTATRIRHVGITEDGALLVCCYEKHAQLKFNLDGSVEHWSKENGLAGNKVRVAIQDKKGDLYIGTTTGLSIVHKSDGTITNINKDDVLENDFIMCLFENDDGSIWFGTDGGGVYILNPSTLEITKKLTKEDGLAGNVVFKIAEIRKDEIWISTGSGVSVISKKDGSIFNFDSSKGFSVDGVFQVLTDYTLKVWATSNHGIFSVKMRDIDEVMRGERSSVTPNYFSRLDGITSGGVTSTSLSMKDDKGRLWFTLIDGFTVLDPVRNASNTDPHAVKIQYAMLDNEKIDLVDNQKLIIPPNVKRLNLKYTGITFVSSEKVEFKTKLQGFDTEYSDWTTERTASYTNLKPGNYKFFVTSRNPDGYSVSKYVENSVTTSIEIVKKAYFWQHAWFAALLVLLIIGIVTLIVYLRFAAIRRRQEEIQKLSMEVTSALAQTIDAKDKYTKGHSNRVAKYSKMLAAELGESERTQEQIYYAALLHDIGKIGVPNAIINKPDKLTDEEYEIIKTHPVIGSDILKSISSMPEIAIGARSHHERYDGKGYPDGLVGEEIPWIARIIGVADAYDAMTSNRSYRSYLPQDRVRAEIEKYRGIQFDPRVADAMLKLIEEDVKYMMHE